MLKYIGRFKRLLMKTREDLNSKLELVYKAIAAEKAQIVEYAQELGALVSEYKAKLEAYIKGEIPKPVDYTAEVEQLEMILQNLDDLSEAAVLPVEIVEPEAE